MYQSLYSSSRMRGTQNPEAPASGLFRFIPTSVGNSTTGSTPIRNTQVHPHRCGEYLAPGVRGRLAPGPSPHRWGTQAALEEAGLDARFIPTPVGNTGEPQCPSWRRPVHPHTCGEHGSLRAGVIADDGSSPHPWGTRPARGRYQHLRRFIPTPVGNTRQPRESRRAIAVHPHTRGEHRMASRMSRRMAGSSPHPWGTRKPTPAACLHRRFIPTPVGNTGCAETLGSAASVHPHTRGEHVVQYSVPPSNSGSSPHPWGTHQI